MTRMASGWVVPQMSVVTRERFHGSSSSAMRSLGPQSATSSTSASGTSASASRFLPAR